MAAMKKREQLDRVEADLARGHTYTALQRLANLTALFPDDLDIRMTRARVNRQIGNTAEAGRWGFLTEDVSAAEVAAFELAFRRPADRLSALRLPGNPGAHPGPLATARLRDLSLQAQQGGAPVLGTPTGPMDGVIPLLGCAAIVMIMLAVLGLAFVGLLAVVR